MKKPKVPKLKVKDFESKYNALITRLRVEQLRLNEIEKAKPKPKKKVKPAWFQLAGD